MRVGKRGLDKLRKKYNNTLNEVPAPLIYEKQRKPKKHPLLKQQQHNYRALVDNSAYGHRLNSNNSTEIRRGKNRNRNRQRKNRKNNKNNNQKNNRKMKTNDDLYVRNGTAFSDISMEHGYNDYRKNKKRNRRYKSKESKESKENNSLEEEFQRNKHTNNSMEELTQKTTFMTNTLSPFHPQVIVEEHDFFELNNN